MFHIFVQPSLLVIAIKAYYQCYNFDWIMLIDSFILVFRNLVAAMFIKT